MRAAPLVRERRTRLVATFDARWRDLLEGADVVSEGRTLEEGGAIVYYGTTSVLLSTARIQAVPGAPAIDFFAAVARFDPHVRVRALRIAYREASVRAAAPLLSMRAEVEIRATARGVLVEIDVVADVRRAKNALRRP